MLARRIINYKEALGGFVDMDQVKEVYGLPLATFDHIIVNLSIDKSNLVRKLNINLLDVDALAKHPYINKKQAHTIVNYRAQHGDFKKVESLSEIQSLNSDFLRKIEPYLEY